MTTPELGYLVFRGNPEKPDYLVGWIFQHREPSGFIPRWSTDTMDHVQPIHLFPRESLALVAAKELQPNEVHGVGIMQVLRGEFKFA